MNLLIGEKIKSLRRMRDLTQEEVAAHLGVSYQAVSKWERSEGYPDITMLPAIANYFGITVDELLGMREAAGAARYDEINRTWEENRQAGRHCENVALMREALGVYPNDALLLVQLSASLERLDGNEAERRANLRESVAVQEQILRHCPDSAVRGAVMYNICFAYRKLGEDDRALAQAKKLPNLYKAQENALVYLLKGEERREVARGALEPLAWALAHHLGALADGEDGDRWRTKIGAIFDILFEGGESEWLRAVREKAGT